jgi:HEAT repeat protein
MARIRPLSAAAHELLTKVLQPPGLRERLFGVQSRRETLDRLIALGEVDVLPRLLWRLAMRDADIEETGDAIEALSGALSPADLAHVDEVMRRSLWPIEDDERAWSGVTPAGAIALARRLNDRVRTVSLLALHGNGRVREVILHELSARADGRELPVLALRANDWVDPVAKLASALLLLRITPGNRRGVLGALPFLVRTLRQSRRDHSGLAVALHATLMADEGASALEAFATFDRTTRRFLWEQLAGSAGTCAAGIVRAALGDRDPALRGRAAALLARTSDAHETVRVLEHLATSDRAALVRRRALTVLAERSSDRTRAALPRTLLDTSTSVRVLSQRLVKQLDASCDPRALYLQAIEQRSREYLHVAVAGLAEGGQQEDANTIEAVFHSPSPRVRRAVLRALAGLAPDRAVSLAATAVSDAAPRVRASALRVLASHRSGAENSATAERLLTHPERAMRLLALRLTRHASKWGALTVRLEALGDRNEAVRACALRLVDDWLSDFNRRQVAPSDAEWRRANALARLHAARLPEETRKLLEFTLSVVG